MGRSGDLCLKRSKRVRRICTALLIIAGAVIGVSIAVSVSGDSPIWSRVLLGLFYVVIVYGGMVSVGVFFVSVRAMVTGLRHWKKLRDAKRVAYSWVQFGGVSPSELEAVTQTLESARTDREAKLLLECIREREEKRSGTKDKKRRRVPMSNAEAEKLTKKWQEETAEQAIRVAMAACIAGEMRAGRSQEEAMRICHAKIAKQLGANRRG